MWTGYKSRGEEKGYEVCGVDENWSTSEGKDVERREDVKSCDGSEAWLAVS